jgi:phosphohistidine phosphatase
MDLLLWRHAEAEGEHSPHPEDLLRRLTPHGCIQAKRMAAWILPRLPSGTRVLSSPAVRCESTAAYLDRKYKLSDALLPTAGLQEMLELIRWPERQTPTLLVGHQPVLGELVALLTGVASNQVSMRKGCLWWLRSRERLGHPQTVTHCVMGPDLL